MIDKHTFWSFLKSCIRILGFLTLIPRPFYAVIYLIIAEVIGIIEEL